MSFPGPVPVTQSPVSAVVGLLVAGVVGWLAFRQRKAIAAIVTRFWSEPDSAFNLAFFRFVFFMGATLIVLPEVANPETVSGASELPSDLVMAPAILGQLNAALPRSAGIASICHIVLVVTGFTAAFGLLPRISAAIWTLILFYYLGIPNLFGKVNHSMHLIWIGAVMALSPIGDVLSVQSAVRGIRGVANPATEDRSRSYAIPLRLIWVFIGLVYLFPGTYKYLGSGLGWLNPDTQRGWTDFAIAQRPGFDPPISFDSVPILLFFGAMAALIFETTAIVMILTRITRAFLAFEMMMFHTLVRLTMGISFTSMQICAPALIDWSAVSGWVMRRRGQLVFAADANCGICQKTVEVLKAQALPGSMSFTQAQVVAERRDVPGLEDVSLDALVTDIHLTDGERVWVGYRAYRRAAWRIPALWITIPLLYLWPVIKAGEAVYGYVSTHRACGIRPAPPRERRIGSPLVPLYAGVPIVLVALFCGLPIHSMKPTTEGWPVAAYPLFAGKPPVTTSDFVALYTEPGSGRQQVIDLRAKFGMKLRNERLQMMMSRVSEDGNSDKAQALLRFASEGLPVGTKVVLVEKQLSVPIDGAPARVIEEKDVATLTVGGGSA